MLNRDGKSQGWIYSIAVAFSAAIIVLQGCGPMNARPPGTNPTDGTGDGGSFSSGAYGETLGFTQNHAFVVRTKSIDPASAPPVSGPTVSAMMAHALKKPFMGDNVYMIRLYKDADMDAVSSTASVAIQYVRASAKIKKTFNAAVTKNPDGSFTSTLTFKKRGTWEVHIQVTDGTTNDEHVFQLILS